jgi:hypothetical protein
MEEMCVCGHAKSEHETIEGFLVCFHEDEKTHEAECACMEFKAAPFAENAQGKGA